MYHIEYSRLIDRKEFRKLPTHELEIIKRVMEERLTTHPDVFGKPLRKSLHGFRSLRVGDYRVIYRIEGKVVRVYAIGHRSVIYKKVERGGAADQD
ncbi:type II toxin-antitoxin system RelE/ParE family toxin [Candidatus Peregrinibacteria bacterium]|nr:type II toxin-antitoxin system RelE/ParE family toxin [Candidatus Peregrinibacteria bacterium]